MAPRIIDMLDFDDSRSWTSPLTAALAHLVSDTAVEKLVAAASDFISMYLSVGHTGRCLTLSPKRSYLCWKDQIWPK